jgi:putative restriction endonuclease
MATAGVDYDQELREAAFRELRRLAEPRGGEVTREEMTAGFVFDGQRIPFAVERKGIWRPRQLKGLGPALSVTTAAVKKGNKPKYDDQIAADTGYFEYKYQGEDPAAWENVSLRRAFELHRPLIYFYGVAPGLYEAIFPAYIVEDDPDNLTVRITPDAADLSHEALVAGGSVAAVKAYMAVLVKRRLHQHRFRELVVAAYRESCAVCRLRHPELLDAAHILEDRDERGKPEVPNGLALCKIHHAAFDTNILGISPKGRIHIRESVLKEKDGPMLEHGLKGLHGEAIQVPRQEPLRPNPAYLQERYSRFLGFRAA